MSIREQGTQERSTLTPSAVVISQEVCVNTRTGYTRKVNSHSIPVSAGISQDKPETSFVFITSMTICANFFLNAPCHHDTTVIFNRGQILVVPLHCVQYAALERMIHTNDNS